MGNAAFPVTLGSERIAERATTRARVAAIPWYVWCLAAAVTSDAFGGYWDISWHISIGRDTFWTPAHMMVYLAGVLSAISCGYAILTTTFGSSREMKDQSVSIWGFRGPLGCFIATWGAFAMLTSAPFDNWWHNAYGLDVKIVSLPHSILALGEAMISLGAMLLICAQVNRASGEYQKKLDRLLVYVGGVEIFGAALFALESTPMEFMHSSGFYRAMASTFPVVLIAISRASKSKWPATTMAAVYTVGFLAFLWIFPLFSSAAETGSGLPADHAYDSAVVPDPAHRARIRARPAAQSDGRAMGQLDFGAARRMRLHRRVPRGAVAVREFPHVGGGAQSHLRHHLFRILRRRERLL